MTPSEALFTSRIRKRTPLVYGCLLAMWGMVIFWQVLEHRRVQAFERTALVNRSHDIATTLGVVVRSLRRFQGIVPQDRLEAALKELAKSGELVSVALLNASDEVVASAGRPMDIDQVRDTVELGERWDEDVLTKVYPVDLGASVTTEGGTNLPTIVLPPREGTNSTRNPGRMFQRPETPAEETSSSNAVRTASADPNPGGGRDDGRRDRGGRPPFESDRGPRGRGGRPPFWMDQKEYQSLVETRGLHGLAMAMSTASVQTACNRDLWLRFVISGFACVSVLGLGLAWQNLIKSSALQIYLLRASEMNAHLREMNVAAAGLAHETRNPLNIVRGLAQMISQESVASEDTKSKSRQITSEVDRVTAQLNEFINYSRPREVRRSPVAVNSVVGDVVRALQSDIEDKAIQLKVDGDSLVVDADEQLLRQVLFNLLINGIQSVEPRGRIDVVARRSGANAVQLEVRDDGPGVPAEHRAEIFKPYFTTRPTGTGLGLAVVQQIVLAHGWEIECVPNEPKGAVFRLRHLKFVSKNGGKA